MPEYLRVKDKSTGHKLSVIASVAADEDAYQVLKQDAVDIAGDPLPPEYATSSPASSGHPATDNTKEKQS